MGYRVERRTARLRLEEPFEGAELVCRLDINTELYMRIAPLIERSQGQPTGELVGLFAEQIIESWNLEDAQGAPLPIQAETILRELPAALVGQIMAGWQAAMDTEVSVAAPLGPPSSAPGTSGPAPSAPMEPR